MPVYGIEDYRCFKVLSSKKIRKQRVGRETTYHSEKHDLRPAICERARGSLRKKLKLWRKTNSGTKTRRASIPSPTLPARDQHAPHLEGPGGQNRTASQHLDPRQTSTLLSELKDAKTRPKQDCLLGIYVSLNLRYSTDHGPVYAALRPLDSMDRG
jgi:hypothetical protein